MAPKNVMDKLNIFSADAFVPSLDGNAVRLRALKKKDAEDLYEYGKDPSVTKYVLWDSYHDIREAREYIRQVRSQYRRGQNNIFGIEYEGKLIGTIGFMWITPETASAEIGYSLNRAFWNRGLATDAVKTLLRHAFEDLRLNRVEAQHDERNAASGRVMQKAGMRYEGTLRERIKNKGHFIDVSLYAILKKDWESDQEERS